MTRHQPTDEPLIGIAELARRLDVPVATVYRWRRYSQGPRGFLVGKHVKFRPAEVEAWLQAQREPEPIRATPIRRQGAATQTAERRGSAGETPAARLGRVSA